MTGSETPSNGFSMNSEIEHAGYLLERLFDFSEPVRVPPPYEYVTSPDYLDAKGYTCDLVLQTFCEIFDPAQHHTEVALDWGIGTGKSFLTALITSYMAFRVIALGDPLRNY